MFGGNSSAFGTSGFGNKSSSGNAFANQSNPFATSSTNSGFGGFGAFKNTGASSNASSQQSGIGGFGAKSDAPSQLSAFGSTGLGNTTNGFGSSGFGSTGFAKSTPPSNSGFGSSGFGAKSNPTASAFGQSGFDHQDFCRQIPATAAVCHLDKWETQINHHRLEQQPHNLLPLDLQQLSHLITNLHHSVKLTHQIHLLFQIQLQPPRQPTLHLHLDHLTIFKPFWWPIFNKLAIWANTNIFFYIWCQQSNAICIWNGINSKYKSGIWVKQFSIDYREHQSEFVNYQQCQPIWINI